MFPSSLISKPALWIGLGLGLLVLLASRNPIAQNLENTSFDLFTRWSANPTHWPGEIAIVMIDESSLQTLGRRVGRWPWPRSVHGALAADLRRQGARAVVFDALFAEPSENVMEDDRFATWIKAVGNIWLARLVGQTGNSLEPVSTLKDAVGTRVGHVDIEKDSDGVVRHYFTRNVWGHAGSSSLAVSVADGNGMAAAAPDSIILRWYARQDQLQTPPASIFVLEGLEIMGQVQRRGAPKDFDTDDVQQVVRLLRSEPPPSTPGRFRDQIVFVGCSAAATFDSHATPLNGHEPGVMVQATALANLIRCDYLLPTPFWMRAFLILASSTLVTVISQRAFKLRWQIILSLLILILILGISYAMFCANRWLPPAMAMVAGAVSFTGIMTWRYFIEDRRKRELKQLFSDFVSPDVLEELQSQAGGINLGGDSREGSVLFCDLVGFTTLAATTSPKQFFDAINTYLSEASQALLAHGAYIDKFIGDAVMAVFGVPKPQPDHALRACFAALDLREMMVSINERLGRQYNLKLGLRTGVNSGEMLTGALGYARKLNYTVIGDTVNLASRLEGANKEYGTLIMIGPQTYEQAKDGIETRFLDLLRVKGEVRAFAVYELMERKGKLTPEKEKLREAYNEGIEHYRQRRWNEALASFDGALKIHPEDGPSSTYRGRCEHYKIHPPSKDWDGSFGLDHK